MSCFVQYAPYDLREPHVEGSIDSDAPQWDQHRDAFGDAVIDTIAEHAPNLKDLILHRQVLTPLDMERTFGLTEGNIFQGELTLEQLFFMRPAQGGWITNADHGPVHAARRHTPAAVSWVPAATAR
jgi:phytoene dehydrogenase-like protein